MIQSIPLMCFSLFWCVVVLIGVMADFTELQYTGRVLDITVKVPSEPNIHTFSAEVVGLSSFFGHVPVFTIPLGYTRHLVEYRTEEAAIDARESWLREVDTWRLNVACSVDVGVPPVELFEAYKKKRAPINSTDVEDTIPWDEMNETVVEKTPIVDLDSEVTDPPVDYSTLSSLWSWVTGHGSNPAVPLVPTAPKSEEVVHTAVTPPVTAAKDVDSHKVDLVSGKITSISVPVTGVPKESPMGDRTVLEEHLIQLVKQLGSAYEDKGGDLVGMMKGWGQGKVAVVDRPRPTLVTVTKTSPPSVTPSGVPSSNVLSMGTSIASRLQAPLSPQMPPVMTDTVIKASTPKAQGGLWDETSLLTDMMKSLSQRGI